MMKVLILVSIVLALLFAASWGTEPAKSGKSQPVICGYCDGGGGTRPTCDAAHAGQSWYDVNGGYHECRTDGTNYYWWP